MNGSPVLRVVLFLAGLACLDHGIHGLRRGTIHLKGVTSERVGRPLTFWSSVLVIAGFGLMLLWFAVFGRFGS